MHHCQLPRVIELETRDTLSAGQNGWRGQFTQLAAVDKGLQDVLLNVVVVVDDFCHSRPELGQIFDILVYAEVVHVVGSWLGSQWPQGCEPVPALSRWRPLGQVCR